MENKLYERPSEEAIRAYEEQNLCHINMFYAETCDDVVFKYYNKERTWRIRKEYSKKEGYRIINEWWEKNKSKIKPKKEGTKNMNKFDNKPTDEAINAYKKSRVCKVDYVNEGNIIMVYVTYCDDVPFTKKYKCEEFYQEVNEWWEKNKPTPKPKKDLDVDLDKIYRDKTKKQKQVKIVSAGIDQYDYDKLVKLAKKYETSMNDLIKTIITEVVKKN